MKILMAKCALQKIGILLLIVAMLTSCSGQTDISDQTTEESISTGTTVEVQETDYLQSIATTQFDGAEYRTLTSGWAGTSAFFSEEITGDAVRDSMYNRDKIIEEMFGCTLTYTMQERYEAATTLQNCLSAGDMLYHEFGNCIPAGGMTTLVAMNGLYNLYDIPEIDLSQPWWSSLLVSSLTLHDKLFYVTGDIVPTSLINAFCIYVNLDLFSDYGYDEQELYESIYNGEWTWDTLYGYCGEISQDVNQDNKMHTSDDFFGFISQDNAITTNAMLIGAGVDLSGIDDEGHLQVDINNESVLKVIENIQRVKKMVKYDDQESVQKVVFPENRAMFCQHLVSSSVNIYRDMDIDYSILPIPKGSIEQESYRSLISTWSEVYVTVPSCCPDTQMTGTIMEAMAYIGYRDTHELMFEVTLKDKVMRNADSQKILDIVFNTLYLDYNVIYNFGGSGDMLNQILLGKKEFASSLQSIETKISNDVQIVEEVYSK